MKISHEDLKEFVELQLAAWPLAKKNHDALAQCLRRKFRIGDLDGAFQYNPARIRSTGADTSDKGVASRKCFLCSENRPTEQIAVPIEEGWELLVNPFPIFPMHFTIASNVHRPQHEIAFEIISMAEKLEGMTVFFNGSKAGASAPDHSHMQAVLTEELPLMRLIEESHTPDKPGIASASELGLDLPFDVVSALITPDPSGMRDIVGMLDPADGLLNFFAFIGRDGWLRLVRVERTAHRPTCYYSEESDRLLVSPGCVDMAGIVITPRKEDFDRITVADIDRIYRETGKPAHTSPGD